MNKNCDFRYFIFVNRLKMSIFEYIIVWEWTLILGVMLKFSTLQ